MAIKWNTTMDDAQTIKRIVNRAWHIASDLGCEYDKMTGTMDLSACHGNGCKLKLAELLAADQSDFVHDVFGIRTHIDRNTGKLTDCFLPRYADMEATQ